MRSACFVLERFGRITHKQEVGQGAQFDGKRLCADLPGFPALAMDYSPITHFHPGIAQGVGNGS
jgi:hypothetical protein